MYDLDVWRVEVDSVDGLVQPINCDQNNNSPHAEVDRRNGIEYANKYFKPMDATLLQGVMASEIVI